jgi:hypothetical protein
LDVIPALAADTFKAGVKDAYEGLKAVICRKWGETAPISKAIAAVEADPNSKARAALLGEKVGALKASEDADVSEALNALLEQMKAHGISSEAAGGVHVTIAGGTQTRSVIAGNISARTMNVGNRKKGTISAAKVSAGSIVINNYPGAPPEPVAFSEGIGDCPYRGLADFGPNEAACFFGRDAAIDPQRSRERTHLRSRKLTRRMRGCW